MSCIETIKNLANIFFFIGVPSIAFLAFRQAKNTIFNTQKNEVFKLQLKEYEEVLSLLYSKDVKRMVNKFKLGELAKSNAKRITQDIDYINGKISDAEYKRIDGDFDNIWLVANSDNINAIGRKLNARNVTQFTVEDYQLFGLHIDNASEEFFEGLAQIDEFTFIQQKHQDEITVIKESFFKLRWGVNDRLMKTFRSVQDRDSAFSKEWMEYACIEKISESKEMILLFNKVQELCLDIRKYINVEHVMK